MMLIHRIGSTGGLSKGTEYSTGLPVTQGIYYIIRQTEGCIINDSERKKLIILFDRCI